MANQPMQTSDLLTRIAGGVMIIGAIWNFIFAVIQILLMIWICIGAWWIVPAILSIVQIAAGVFAIAKGHSLRPLAFAPFLGLVVSLCNLNFCALFIDVIAIGLGLGGWFTYQEPNSAVVETP